MITDTAASQAIRLFNSGTDIPRIVNYLKTYGATAEEIAQRWPEYAEQAYQTDWTTASVNQIRDQIHKFKAEGKTNEEIAQIAADAGIPYETMSYIYSDGVLNGAYEEATPTQQTAPTQDTQPAVVQNTQPAVVQNTQPTSLTEIQPGTGDNRGWMGLSDNEIYNRAGNLYESGKSVDQVAAMLKEGQISEEDAKRIFPNQLDAISNAYHPTAIDYQNQATDQSKEMLGAVRDYAVGATNPYINAGHSSLANMQDMVGQKYGQQNLQNLENLNPNISANYNDIINDPMYQFARDQGSELLNRNLAAQGMVGSRYGADAQADLGMRTALNERDRIYGQNVDNFNRSYGQQNDLYNAKNQEGTTQFNQNASLAGLGQNTAVNMTNAATNWGNSWVDLTTGMADAQASNDLSKYAINAQQDTSRNNLLGQAGGIVLDKGLDWLLS